MITPVENNQSERNQYYEKHRKKFPRLVVCKDCVRSYDASEMGDETINCKFCGSANLVVKGKHIFKYFCPACDRSFISEEKETACRKCGGKYLHMMRLSDLSKSDKMEIRKAKLKDGIKGVGKKFRTNIGKLRKNMSYETKKRNKPDIYLKQKIKQKLTVHSKKKKQKKSLFNNNKKHEEMPTY